MGMSVGVSVFQWVCLCVSGCVVVSVGVSVFQWVCRCVGTSGGYFLLHTSATSLCESPQEPIENPSTAPFTPSHITQMQKNTPK